MTINRAIDLADDMRPNSFERSLKGEWLAAFERRLSRELGLDRPLPSYPEDGGAELLAGDGFGQIYVLFLCAQIDWGLREYDNWNNSVVMFNAMMSDFKKQYLRDNLPARGEARGVWRAEA